MGLVINENGESSPSLRAGEKVFQFTPLPFLSLKSSWACFHGVTPRSNTSEWISSRTLLILSLGQSVSLIFPPRKKTDKTGAVICFTCLRDFRHGFPIPGRLSKKRLQHNYFHFVGLSALVWVPTLSECVYNRMEWKNCALISVSINKT